MDMAGPGTGPDRRGSAWSQASMASRQPAVPPKPTEAELTMHLTGFIP